MKKRVKKTTAKKTTVKKTIKKVTAKKRASKKITGVKATKGYRSEKLNKKSCGKQVKGKCKLYKKIHESSEVADIHAKRIKARGGSVTKTKKSDGRFILEYSFGTKKK